MNPISTRHVQFIKNTNSLNDYTLRVEIYGRPQGTLAKNIVLLLLLLLLLLLIKELRELK